MDFKNFRSLLHVIVQFSILFYFLISGPVVLSGFLLIPELAGIVLVIWAIYVMRKSTLTIFPIPGNNFRLIKTGPYRIIRHPMYTSLLLILVPLTIDNFNWLRLTLLLIFTLNIVLKLLFEENLIRKKVPEYDKYCTTTWRLIPILF